jgi:hypothetical protein
LRLRQLLLPRRISRRPDHQKGDIKPLKLFVERGRFAIRAEELNEAHIRAGSFVLQA